MVGLFCFLAFPLRHLCWRLNKTKSRSQLLHSKTGRTWFALLRPRFLWR
jgi:hypothetical protein